MAPADPEKHAAAMVEDDDAPDWSPCERGQARRVVLLWSAVLLVALLFLTEAASSWCPSRRLPLIQHWAPRVSQGRPEPQPQAIKSRPLAVKPRETTATSSAAAPSRTVLKTFEVAPPVLMPDGPAESDGSTRHGKDYAPELCTVLLMRHDFAWSYGAPFVGNYTPPDCDFNRVVLNFSAVSHGRQYDRLAIMYFGDTEVWRTSTAQPTVPPGISWIYLKDMTEYLYFWKSPQKIIFDLGNLINDRYTGIFNTTMTAIFYNSNVVTDQETPSDLIIPISARQGANNSVSHFTLPAQNATNTISLPRNVRRAVFSVSANGQATEEFWWSNVLQSDRYTFNTTAGAYPGYSPFREVQVLIDGQLAGVEWPFPVIFTGGVVPSLHRPIVGIHAFDLKEHEIDITPFLPLLCDGAEHTFTIRIAGLDDDPANSSSVSLTESVNESWYVTGKIFLWLDEDPDSITTGEPPAVVLTPPSIAVTRAVTTNGTANETLTYTTSVLRSLRITSNRVNTQHISSPASWSQLLSYTNRALLTAFGYSQVNDLIIAGDDQASFYEGFRYRSAYRYPLFANSTYAVSAQGNLSIWAHVIQGKEVGTSGRSVFPTGLEAFAAGGRDARPATVSTTKEGTAEFRQSGDARESSGWGGSRQVLWFGAGREELYFRNVSAVNGSVVYDHRRMAGKEVVVGVHGDTEDKGVMGAGADIGDGVVFAQVDPGIGLAQRLRAGRV